MSDGTRIFVMLSPVPVAKDGGNDCKLPNGQQLKLRDTFPSSGLYEIGSDVPIWSAAWYGEKSLAQISADGRFAVCVNEFGGGGWGEDVKPRWGIKFYDRGAEIKSYDVVDLVDYPSLMEFTSADWHRLWIDQSVYDSRIEDGFFALRTSTRERYRFDISTGAIVEEHRSWRHVVRGGYLILALVSVAGGYRGYRSCTVVRSPVVDEIESGDEPTTLSWRTFRLRSIFFLITLAAVACAYPHVAIFLSVFAVAVFCTLKLSGMRRRGWYIPSVRRAKRWRMAWWAAAIASWLVFYVLSVGPTYGVAAHLRCASDIQMAMSRVYTPVWALIRYAGPSGFRLIELYMNAW
jgi:hypothetical protein